MNTLRLPQLLAAALGGWLCSLSASAADAPVVRNYVDPAPYIATIAGSGVVGSANGSGLAASFNIPTSSVADAYGNIFVVDHGNHVIRRISSSGEVTTFCGSPGQFGYANGNATTARFNNPIGVAIDPSGNLYVTDSANHVIRQVSPNGTVATIAGLPGQPGAVDGPAASAKLNLPKGIARDLAGNLYVADANSKRIRKITPAGTVSTLVDLVAINDTLNGPGQPVGDPFGIAVDQTGSVYYSEWTTSVIRRVSPDGAVTTFAGRHRSQGSTDGDAATARFHTPAALAIDSSGNLYVADRDNHLIRRVTPQGLVSTFAGSTDSRQSVDGLAGAAGFFWPVGLGIDAKGNVLVTDQYTHQVRRSIAKPVFINLPPAEMNTVAGSSAVSFYVELADNSFQFPTTVQWRKNGVAIAGATTQSLRIPQPQPADSGSYTIDARNVAGTTVSNPTQLNVIVPPTITTQPRSQTVNAGQSVEFSVQATPTAGAGLVWRKNGVSIPGASTATLSIAAATAADSGSYSVVVFNQAGQATSADATLTVRPEPTPAATSPVITTGPQSRAVAVGEAFSLTVTATGTAPLSHQWFRNGAALAGATGVQFSVTRARTADAGAYHVVVTNSAGTATSNSATITVNEPAQRPAIAAQPQAQTATAGGSAQFAVTATGTGPFTFQWRKDGVAIPGATAATLALSSVQSADAGSYSVTITNSAGSVTSAAVALTVAPGSRLSNLSIRTSMGAGQTVIVGLATTGGGRDVLVRAVGPALAQFGLTGAMADPRLELFRGQTLVLGNDNWAPELAPAFASVGAFALPLGSGDAAIRQNLDGAVSLQARGTGAGVVLLEAYDIGLGSASRLVNVSARNRVGSGDDILIAGFNLTGTGTKRLLVRAVGPALAAFGVTGTLADPVLELFAGANRIASNDNWSAELAAEFAAVGAFALTPGSRDAALVVTLPPGTYTAQVRGADGSAGEALVEIYELP